MKPVVIYQTKYGSTGEYAHWIGEALGANIIDVKHINDIDVNVYDTVILGSCVYVGHINVATYIKKNWNMLKNKRLVLFSVSGRPPDDKSIKKLYDDSIPAEMQDRIKYFPLWGRIRFKGMGLFDKFIVKITGSKEIDHVEKKNIKEIVDFLKK